MALLSRCSVNTSLLFCISHVLPVSVLVSASVSLNTPLRPVYTKRQSQCCDNSVMMLGILLPLKRMESLGNGLQPHSGVTPLFAMRIELLASSQSCCSVHSDAWCKRTVTGHANPYNSNTYRRRGRPRFCTTCLPIPLRAAGSPSPSSYSRSQSRPFSFQSPPRGYPKWRCSLRMRPEPAPLAPPSGSFPRSGRRWCSWRFRRRSSGSRRSRSGCPCSASGSWCSPRIPRGPVLD